MTPKIYACPAPQGTEVVAASPREVLRTLQTLFPSRFSATGIQLTLDDLGALQPLLRPPTADANMGAWRWIASEIERHGAIHVWDGTKYREEA